MREAFERFITCEYTTIDARRQPIVWPVTPYYADGGPAIDVTTGLGYPKKANDARRNPHVALLFSDPTGSGVTSGLQVLVQGTAEVDDRDLAANRERYWRDGQDLRVTVSVEDPMFLRKPTEYTTRWIPAPPGYRIAPFECDPESARASIKFLPPKYK